jgi:hypothetical protein
VSFKSAYQTLRNLTPARCYYCSMVSHRMGDFSETNHNGSLLADKDVLDKAIRMIAMIMALNKANY